MKNIILGKLQEIEQEQDVKILYACESGSRAWGFESKDSDYDVRFIYVNKLEHYLKFDKTRDVIETPITDEFDINGWDLDKTFRLLYKSNPTLIEWFHSPLVYRQDNAFIDEVKELLPYYYSNNACFYHYTHMASSNYREYLKGDYVRVKKYFYVLRPLLAMEWIDQNRGIVPMLFQTLVNELVTNVQVKTTILKLIAQKKVGFEAAYVPRIEVLNTFIETGLDKATRRLPGEPFKEFNLLNIAFLKLLGLEK